MDSSELVKITDDLYIVNIPDIVFYAFHNELLELAQRENIKDIDKSIFFDKCYSIEQIAKLGIQKLKTERFSCDYENSPCLMLRRESGLKNGFILVGCMTTLSHSSQKKIFSLLPA